MSLLAAATAVTATGEGRYAAEIQPGWDIMGNANGGYLLAIAARAAAAAAGRSDPVSVTAHYMRPAKPGPVTIDIDVLRSGRRFAVARSTMTAEDKLIAVLGTYGALEPSDQVERLDSGPPDLPHPEACIPVEPTETFPPPFMGRVEIRLDPEDAVFATGVPSGRPRIQGWFRLRDDEPLDTLALLVAVDAFPPTIFNADLPIAWTPTIELTAHIRARPQPGWLRCVFTTRFITGGFLEEDGELWDASGRLVAQSRQLALIPNG
ncbi:MAG: thioesterase family protein [Acidimicrobiia bacterium]